MYGLKQALRSWKLLIEEAKKSIGFAKNKDEPCVYIK
ncbi:hypothetical protein J0J18_24115, partial [Vibrio vulnificus]|nr:hypothetical protein [Vibrio vulnificus]